MTAQFYKHVKSGSIYELVGEGRMEANLSPVTIYKSPSGQIWVRPSDEFRDGRFVKVDAIELATP